MSLNSQKARMEPEAVFKRPLDIIDEPGLTRGQKIATLERWEQSLKDRMRATGEGMAPAAGKTADEAATVVDIAKALSVLRNEKPSVVA